MTDKSEIQKVSRQALNAEAHLCKDMIDNISDVKIFGVVKNSNGRIDIIDLVDYFTNFPFDWKTEIKVLMSDAVNQYFEILKTPNYE